MLQLNLAVAFAQQGNLAQALPLFRSAVAAHPDNSQAHANLANALLKSGDVPGAVAAYREALRLKPDWPQVSATLAWVLANHKDARISDDAGR